MPYNFDHIPERRGWLSAKWEHYPADVLPMFVADMDFPSPEPVVQALRRAVEHGFFGYPSGLEWETETHPALAEAFTAWVEQRYGWRVAPDWIVYLPGVVVGFNLACHMQAEGGKAVVVQPPVYPPMLGAGRHAGLERRDAALAQCAGGPYEMDFDALEQALAGAGTYLLCNPHNPVGRAFTPAELGRAAELCLRAGALIVSDEIHADLVFPEARHTPIAALDAEIARNSITLLAPSKTFNLAGLQCSLAVIPDLELRRRYLKARRGLTPWVNLLGLAAAEAAYHGGGEWLAQVMAYLDANRAYLAQAVETELPGVRMALPEATYLAWLDFRGTPIAAAPGEALLKQGRVALVEGSSFGPGGEGFARLNFACPRPMLVEAVRRMARVVRGE
jgi:cystathionine beta-lyase